MVVVGSGVAGLSAILELARPLNHGPTAPDRVILLTRGRAGRDGASPWAQGGVAAALDPTDSPRLHALDTEAAGAGHSSHEMVEILTREGPPRVRELVGLGARFDRDAAGELALGMEAAHSRRRVLHARGDRTGEELTRVLGQAVAGLPGLTIVEEMEALDLVVEEGRVQGVVGRASDGSLWQFSAPAVLLATGGSCRLYLRTTSPPGMRGDGLAMAYRAGARVTDLEFVQFHPTALAVDADPLPLVTEALRGEGAVLVDQSGRRVLTEPGEDELSPRDVVARALWRRLQKGERVFLDARAAVGDAFPMLFPAVHERCLRYGVDPVRAPIPVTPAAHYHMGGVAVDADGRTTIPGLWAAGEVAASGVHGANRLASNSLLEGLVFGGRAGASIRGALPDLPGPGPAGRTPAAGSAPTDPESDEAMRRIRTLLWEQVGLVRSADGLTSALEELDRIDAAVAAPHPSVPSPRPSGLENALLVARLITRAALDRPDTLGSHYRSDGTSPRTMTTAAPSTELLSSPPEGSTS